MMIVVVVGRFYFIEMLGIQDIIIIIIIIIIIVMKQQILPRAKGKATQREYFPQRRCQIMNIGFSLNGHIDV
jgi:uncharacterized membrane protein YkvA (DUF1232 family)